MLSSKLLALAALASSPVGALWPAPVNMTQGNTTFFIDKTVKVWFNGEQANRLDAAPSPPSLLLTRLAADAAKPPSS